mgnify:CR=1 FL=1
MSLVKSEGASGPIGTVPTQPAVDTSSILRNAVQGINCMMARECASRFPNPSKFFRTAQQGMEAILQLQAMAQGQAMNPFTGQPSMISAAQQLPTEPVEDPKVKELEGKVTAMESKIDLLLERIPA